MLDVTVTVTRGLDSLEVNYLTAKCGNNYVSDVGKLLKISILPNLLTIVAYPVLDVAVVVASGSNCLNVSSLTAKCRENYVLDVGKLGESLILPYLLTVVAYPVLNVTIVVATGLNSLEVNYLAANCGKDYVLDVSELSKLLVLPNLLALVAYPMLDVTVAVARGNNALKANYLAANCGKYYVLNVGKLGESLILPYLLTLVAYPMLDLTVKVARGSDSLEVNYLTANCGNNYVSDIGKLLEISILPYLLTLVAYPVLNVTIVVATGLNCVKVNNLTAKCGKDYVLDVGKLGESLILPYLLTLVAYPVLDVTVAVTISSLCLEVNNLAAKCGKYYVLDVSELLKLCILPYQLTAVTYPVLDVTVVVTTGLNCVKVNNLTAKCRKDYVLDVGKLSEFLILPYLLTLVAYPVLDVTVAVTVGSLCLEVNNLTANCGKYYVLNVGKLSKSLILPYHLTAVAYPVLNVTVVVTAGSNCVEVNSLAHGSGENYS